MTLHNNDINTDAAIEPNLCADLPEDLMALISSFVSEAQQVLQRRAAWREKHPVKARVWAAMYKAGIVKTPVPMRVNWGP